MFHSHSCGREGSICRKWHRTADLRVQVGVLYVWAAALGWKDSESEDVGGGSGVPGAAWAVWLTGQTFNARRRENVTKHLKTFGYFSPVHSMSFFDSGTSFFFLAAQSWK